MPKSKHKYLPNPIHLFDDSAEEDEDDEVPGSFRQRFPQRRQSHSNDREEELQRQRQILIDKQCEIEKRTLASATRSLGLLYNSEDMGINAAEELINQHEILKKASQTLDEMKPHLKESQKNINGINSIIYCIKNYMFGKHVTRNSSMKRTASEHSVSSSSGKLSTVLDKFTERSETDSYESHPATRLREIDHHVWPEPATRSRLVDNPLEANLNEMGNVISRLKDLGLAFGEEISAQNELIDSITERVDETEIRVGVQTKMIQKLNNS